MAVAYLDQREFLSRPKRKWSKTPTNKTGICIHHTGVQGGFGGTGKRDLGDYVSPVIGKCPASYQQMCWAARHRGEGYGDGTPYHVVIDNKLQTVLYNLPFHWRTWHGNGANAECIGLAWDGHSSLDKIKWWTKLAEMIADVVRKARSEGHQIEYLCTHSQYANKPSDPGGEFIDKAIVQAAILTNCELRWDYKAKASAKTLRESVAAWQS